MFFKFNNFPIDRMIGLYQSITSSTVIFTIQRKLNFSVVVFVWTPNFKDPLKVGHSARLRQAKA